MILPRKRQTPTVTATGPPTLIRGPVAALHLGGRPPRTHEWTTCPLISSARLRRWPMPTDDDRASAPIRFEGEARRLTIRRQRLDRDGLFLFGRRYAAQSVTLMPDEVTHLHHGRLIAVDVVGEYLIYLWLHTRDDGSERAARSAAAPGCSGCTWGGIPQRERPDRVPSTLVRAVAARVRVNADRRMGAHNTPQWIIDLANSEQIFYGPGDAKMSKPLNPVQGLRRLWRNWRANTEQPRGHPRRSQGGRNDRSRR